MNAEKIRSYIETGTNLVVLSVVTLIAVIFLWGYIAQRSSPGVRSGLQKGTPVAAIPSVNFNSARRTLILAINTKCGYCDESIPFYRRLVGIAHENHVQVLAVSSEEDTVIRDYLAQTQLSIASRTLADFAYYGVAATPTVILVDDRGLILDFWVGKLSPESEKQLVETVVDDQSRGRTE